MIVEFSNLTNFEKQQIQTAAQLTQSMVRDIESGRLRPGDQLYSTRELAQKLEISRSIIRKSYRDLYDRGYITLNPGTRPVVSALQPDPTPVATIRDNLSEKYCHPESNIPATRCSNSGNILPWQVWRKYVSRYVEQAGVTTELLCTGAHTKVAAQLKHAVSRYLLRSFGVRCDREQVLIFGSRQQAVSVFRDVMLSPTDIVAMDDPCDFRLREMLCLSEANLIPVDLHTTNTCFDSIGRECNFVITSPTNHYPLGYVMPAQQRSRLLHCASDNGIVILEEANECEYTSHSTAVPSLYSMSADKDVPVFYLYNFGKMLAPLTDITALVVPAGFRWRFSHPAIDTASCGTSLLESAVLSDLLNESAIYSFLRRRLKHYRSIRQALYFELTMAFGRSVRISKESSARHLIVEFPQELSTEFILHSAEQAGLSVSHCQNFYFHADLTNQFLMDLAYDSVETVKDRITHFANALGRTAIVATAVGRHS